MKNRVCRVVPLLVAALLAGCFVGDVGKVKDSKMPGWPQYKVSQLLDKRQVCSETKWHSFTDTRDRKIVEYVCEYAPARAYLERVTQERLERIEKDKLARAENQAAQLETKRRSYEQAVEQHNELLASHEDLASQGSPAMQALTKDRATLRSLTSCSSINPEAFVNNEVQFKARQVLKDCERPNPRNPPLQSLENFIEYRWKDVEKVHLYHVRDFPRRVSNSEANVRMHKEDLERLQADDDSGQGRWEKKDAESQRWLSARLAAFQGMKELSQWVIVDGEPSYVGSRVDVLFEGQPVKVPVEASFVFKQAEDNPAGLTPLYEYVLKQMLGQFKDPSAQ